MNERRRILFEPPKLGCVLSLTGFPGGGGKVHDRSPYGNVGTVTGANWARTEGGLPCLSFDGLDDFVTLPSKSVLHFADSDPWVFEAWLKWDGDPGGDYIAYAGKGAGTEDLMLKYAGNNRFVFRDRTNAYNLFVAGSSDVIVGQWTHVAWVADGAGSLSVFLNGTWMETLAGVPTQCYFDHVGKGEDSNRWCYGGLIALSRVYDRVLPDSETRRNVECERALFGVLR